MGVLGCSVRTIQRYLRELWALSLDELVERRRWRSRFSGYTYRVVHVAALIWRKGTSPTTGDGRRVGLGPPLILRSPLGSSHDSGPLPKRT